MQLNQQTEGSSGDSKSNPAAPGSADVEQPELTAAQIAALAGGQSVTWDKQGMSWTLPPNWKETTNETLSLVLERATL